MNLNRHQQRKLDKLKKKFGRFGLSDKQLEKALEARAKGDTKAFNEAIKKQ